SRSKREISTFLLVETPKSLLPWHFSSKQFPEYCIIGTMRSVASISPQVASFLDFCRVEKGLANATVESYRLDLERFMSSLVATDGLDDPTIVRRHIDSLYLARMSSRSIARHVTTIRNFYKFLMEQGVVASDPTALLAAPKHWHSLPKFLNRQQLNDLMAAPDRTRPQGLRDSAMLELLYATR